MCTSVFYTPMNRDALYRLDQGRSDMQNRPTLEHPAMERRGLYDNSHLHTHDQRQPVRPPGPHLRGRIEQAMGENVRGEQPLQRDPARTGPVLPMHRPVRNAGSAVVKRGVVREAKKGPEARTEKAGGTRQAAIDRMRNHLKQKLDVLDATQQERVPDQDVLFEQFDESRFVDWLTKEDKAVPMEEEQQYLYITSASRDKTRWPNPAEFSVMLDGDMDNIVRADLVQYAIPLTESVVNETNNMIRYSLAPHTTINEIGITPGTYTGAQLAAEIQSEFNTTYYSVDILAGTYDIDYSTGTLVNAGTTTYAAVPQFRVTYRDSTRKFYIQMLSSTGAVTNSPVFAIHVQPKQGAINNAAPDDIFDILGFNRDAVAQAGTYDAGSNTYLLYSTTSYDEFGAAISADLREAYSVHGNKGAELNGPCALVIDIPQLNDNDTKQTASSALKTGSCFGVIFTHDRDKMGIIQSDADDSYPIRKIYREGRGRINQLTIRIQKPDGTLYNFGYSDYCMTIRLFMNRAQGEKSVFAR